MTPIQLNEYKIRFSGKNWAEIDYGQKVEYLFQRLSLLDDDNQKNLVLDLTDKFEYIDYGSLLLELQETFGYCVRQKSQSGMRNVLVAPLKGPFIEMQKKAPNGKFLFSKSKSSDMVYPLLKNSLTDETLLDAVKFCDDPFLVSNKFQPGISVMILVDDFIGSGKTAETHINAYIEYLGQCKLHCTYKDFCIVVDIAMKQGVDYLSSLGINCYSKRIQGRGISDDARYTENQKQENKLLMQNIEKKILCKMNPKYSLGFCQSESLVSIMNKVPNNTFPFYWNECVKDIKPIFRRYHE